MPPIFYMLPMIPSSSIAWKYRTPLLKSSGLNHWTLSTQKYFIPFCLQRNGSILIIFAYLWYADPKKRLTFEREIRKNRYFFTRRKFANVSHDHCGCTRCSAISWNRAIANEKKIVTIERTRLGKRKMKQYHFHEFIEIVCAFMGLPSKGSYIVRRGVGTRYGTLERY